MTDPTWNWSALPTPLGEIAYCHEAGGALKVLTFCRGRDAETAAREATPAAVSLRRDAHPRLPAQLEAWFARERTAFDLDVAPEGTPFQQRVWEALRQIPHGQTRSYGELAAALGSPGAARAVGRANGANPIAIVIPCHRVIGADGSLTGFAAGTDLKRALLQLEGSARPAQSGLFESRRTD